MNYCFFYSLKIPGILLGIHSAVSSGVCSGNYSRISSGIPKRIFSETLSDIFQRIHQEFIQRRLSNYSRDISRNFSKDSFLNSSRDFFQIHLVLLPGISPGFPFKNYSRDSQGNQSKILSRTLQYISRKASKTVNLTVL